jgi:hypothetical protein
MMDDSNKIAYLQMIQNVIGRMSSGSLIIKGFTATVFSGILIILFSKNNICESIWLILPIFFFGAIDIYYFKLEKAYRKLYEEICQSDKLIDYSLKINRYKNSKEHKTRALDCIKAPCIWAFYVPIVIFFILIIIIKFKGGN